MLSLARLALVPLLAAPALAQGNVLVVQASGGAPFTSIQAAVAASQPGDVVLVKAGTYTPFAVANQSLSIVADAGASPLVQGTIQVRNLAADRAVLLHGLHAVGAPSASPNDGPGITVKNDAGPVRVQLCTAEGALGFPGLRCEDSNDVALDECALLGGMNLQAWPSVASGAGLDLAGSALALHDSVLTGAAGHPAGPASLGFPGCGGGSGGSALRVLATAFLHSAGNLLEGGDGRNGANGCGGGGGSEQCCFGGEPGHGYRLDSAGSTLWRFDDQVAPGAPGLGGTGSCGCGLVTVCDCWGGDLGMAVWGGFNDTQSTLAGEAPRLSSSLNPAREGQTPILSVDAEPGDLVFLFASRRTAFAPVAGRGVRLVQPVAPYLSLPLGAADAAGNASTGWPVPELGPGVQSAVVHLQVLVQRTSGERRWSNPLALVLLDSAF